MTSSLAPHAGLVEALADDALIYAQRLGEWISRAPQIEEDMALGNIGLDLLGRARALYTLLGSLDGSERSEDDYAYWRDEREFRHVHLVEQPRGDFADEMIRLLLVSAWDCERYAALSSVDDLSLAGIAGKAVVEARYHRDHARLWVLRLGGGTEESASRMAAAVERVGPYVAELFTDHDLDRDAVDAGVGVLPSSLEAVVRSLVDDVLSHAGLDGLPEPTWHSRDGRVGLHSEACGYLMAEMQHLARSHPGATW
ncbi:MAG: 1,2-phenylacetyl-CoA epoxidase subunit PaaC [Actinomycetia bacterium]|nr:1,2-phenylacetyl-CoA epoxidase subunit PaaC [Actinomycetes bacterium]